MSVNKQECDNTECYTDNFSLAQKLHTSLACIPLARISHPATTDLQETLGSEKTVFLGNQQVCVTAEKQ